ncbi:BON domain-containing protein [Aquabacterium sp. OR-4]|uniref:BON domain-containing protein n=1 Tax=Aquabacterium sp. OR-4 TaxID=2978127 RepID=UPI0021B1AB7B|nr:BON domain-containing protein [Aquabacterium sp. OR-4]MDT7834065.1 BON domain-containing protein [Aquabacterium sp. OR-4]
MTHTLTLSRLLATTALGLGIALAAQAADVAQQPQQQPQQPAAASSADDSQITARVKAALMEDQRLAALKISVSTTAGVVVLSGTAPNAESADTALKLAAAVPGVKDVKSELKLQG